MQFDKQAENCFSSHPRLQLGECSARSASGVSSVQSSSIASAGIKKKVPVYHGIFFSAGLQIWISLNQVTKAHYWKPPAPNWDCLWSWLPAWQIEKYLWGEKKDYRLWMCGSKKQQHWSPEQPQLFQSTQVYCVTPCKLLLPVLPRASDISSGFFSNNVSGRAGWSS